MRTPELVSPENRTLFWMCVLVAVNQLGFGAMIPSLPLYAQSFGVPASAIGMAVAMFGLARMLGAWPAGRWSDSLGRRPTLAIGGLVSAFGFLWCAWATSYPEFIAARFVAGFGAGAILTTGQVILSDISTIERRGRVVSIYQGAFLFAVGVGPFPGGLLSNAYGLSAPFVASGVASLLAALIAWFAVPETRPASVQDRGARAAPQSFLAEARALFSHVGYALICLIGLMHAFARTGGLFLLIPLLVTARLGLSPAAIGFGLMLGSICGVLAAYPGGWLTDRYGRKAVIVPSAVLTGVSLLLFVIPTSYAWFVSASIVWGVASSVGAAAPATYAADTAPPGRTAAAISTYRMTADIGYVAGPLALGALADGISPAFAVELSATLLVLAALLFAAFAPETHRRAS